MAGVRLKTTSNGRGYASLLANGSRQLLSFSSGRQQFFKHKIYCLMLMSCHYYVMYCCRYVYYCKLAFIIKTLLIDWLQQKNRPSLKILLLLQFLLHIIQILHKHSQQNYKRPLEAGFLNFPPKNFLEGPKVKISTKNRPLSNFEKIWFF